MPFRILLAAAWSAFVALTIYSVATIAVSLMRSGGAVPDSLGPAVLYLLGAVWFGFPIAFVVALLVLGIILTLFRRTNAQSARSIFLSIGALGGAITMSLYSSWGSASLDVSLVTLGIGVAAGLGGAVVAWHVVRRDWTSSLH
jgi:hypothetical protein